MQLWRRWYCWTALLACGLLLFGTRRGRWPFARRMVATEPFPYHMRSEERPIPFAGLVHVLHHTKMMPEDAAMMPLVRDVVKHARQEFAVDVVYDWHSTEGVAADVRDFDPESEPLLGSRLYMGVRHKSHVVRVGVHTPFAPTEVVDVEDVPVYVVISHRNRCQRLESFARNLNAMENTANLVLAVTDFNTDECDVDILLKALGLRYTANVMKLPGKFSRTLGLQLGCYSAPRQAICLMMDVDLVLPADFITRTRLVTIEHLTAYAPVWSALCPAWLTCVHAALLCGVCTASRCTATSRRATTAKSTATGACTASASSLCACKLVGVVWLLMRLLTLVVAAVLPALTWHGVT